MASIERLISAGPHEVFQVLRNPRAIGHIVVGTRRVRRFDPAWPETGTTLHHSVGALPFVVRDSTVVKECVADQRLVLEARMRPFGVFVATFELRPEGDGCRVTVDEEVVGGLLSVGVLRPVVHQLIKLRNAELARRLARLAEND
jgi:uncharacterized protein YndB with AHSA1/START domain